MNTEDVTLDILPPALPSAPIIAGENSLGDRVPVDCPTLPSTSNSSVWEAVPLLASMIVALFHPSGLPPAMVKRTLILASRTLHGEDSEQLKRTVDDFWDEMPELLDAIVSLFITHHIPILVADSVFDLTWRLWRGDSGSRVLSR